MRGLARLAFSIESVRPSTCSPWSPSLAASACSGVTIFTKPKPRDSRVCGSFMMLHFSTSPYFSNILVTSSSLRRGWIPVTKRLLPGFTDSSSLLRPGGGPLGVPCQLRSFECESQRAAYRSPRPLPIGERERCLGSTSRSPGERERSRA